MASPQGQAAGALGRAPRRPLRVACVIASLRPGGAEGVLAHLASGLAGRGHAVQVLTLAGPDPGALALDPRVTLTPLDLLGPATGFAAGLAANLGRVAGLRRAVLDGVAGCPWPDLLLSFMPETNVLALLALGGKLPVIVAERVHPAWHALAAPWGLLRRLSYHWAAAIAVQTADVPAFFAPSLRARCVVIPNPALPPAAPGAEAPPEPLVAQCLEGDGPLLLGLGRLHPQKGFDLLLRAFALLAPARPGWRLAILGEGPERPRLEELARSLGLAGRVFLPGRTAAPARALRRATVFALSSRYEGFPNALLDALACGAPCAAFDCPSGPAAILRHEVDGLLAPFAQGAGTGPGQVQALASALARLMDDVALRQRLAARAPEVLERFGLEKTLDLWEALFHGVLAGRG